MLTCSLMLFQFPGGQCSCDSILDMISMEFIEQKNASFLNYIVFDTIRRTTISISSPFLYNLKTMAVVHKRICFCIMVRNLLRARKSTTFSRTLHSCCFVEHDNFAFFCFKIFKYAPDTLKTEKNTHE